MLRLSDFLATFTTCDLDEGYQIKFLTPAVYMVGSLAWCACIGLARPSSLVNIGLLRSSNIIF